LQLKRQKLKHSLHKYLSYPSAYEKRYENDNSLYEGQPHYNLSIENKKILDYQNPNISSSNINVASSEHWDFQSYLNLHQKNHQDNEILCWHTIGFLTFIFMLCVSLVYALYGNSFKFVCWGFGGFVIGFLIAHTIPGLFKRMSSQENSSAPLFGGCSACFFSSDTFRRPMWALQTENHVLLHHVLRLVTYNRTNCLSGLYQDPSWGKTFNAVKDKLVNGTPCA